MKSVDTRIQRQTQQLSVIVALGLFISILLPWPTFAMPASSNHQTELTSVSDVRTIRKFDTDEPVIALTFDAGSDRGYALQILDTLRAKGVRATFGMTGVWAEQNPDLVKRMYAEGHLLMNHSWNHPSFPAISSAERSDQLKRTEDLVRSQTGSGLQPYFRPPFGEYDDATLQDLAANGYLYNVLWTVDTLGWDGYSAKQITERVLHGAAPGAIMLMHVGIQSEDAIALPGIIDQLRDAGYRFATIDDFVTDSLNPSRYFPTTDLWIKNDFLRYWQHFGGLEQFGYPLTEAYERDGVMTQYFERARFEWRPDSGPEHYNIQLGLLGNELTGSYRSTGALAFQPVEAESDSNCRFFAETSHRLCFGFRDYWDQHGSLAIYGFPISEEFSELNPDTGQLYTVQYFERARFEWHPESSGTPSVVLLGRLGAQQLALE